MRIEWRRVTPFSKVLAMVIFIVFPFIGFYWGIQYGGSLAPHPPSSGLSMTIVANHDTSDPLYKIAVEYPQFAEVPAELNVEIEKFVSDNLADFRQTVKENWEARQDTRPSGTPAFRPQQIYYFGITWEAAQLNDRYISFVLRMNSFEGGANERQEMAAFNYDLSKRTRIDVQSFFADKKIALQTLADRSRMQLKEALSAAAPGYFMDEMLAEGTKPVPQNYGNFIFNDDVVTIFFPKYQVAPGSFGEQRVGIVRSTLPGGGILRD